MQGRLLPLMYSAERTTLCRALRHSLQFGAFPVPGSDVLRRDALSGAGVEIPQYLRGYLEFPQAFEVKQSLPCLPHCRISMQYCVAKTTYAGG